MLDELIAEGRRILIFSQFTSMLDLIRPRLDTRKSRYILLTGDTPGPAETPIQALPGRAKCRCF